MTTPLPTDPTRERLRSAALRVFSSKGYQASSIRDICKEADANISAISYYFGDKASLYRSLFKESIERLTTGVSTLDASSPVVGLKGYYKVLLAPLGEGEEAAMRTHLYAREEVEPTGLIEHIVDDVKSAHEKLTVAVAKWTGKCSKSKEVQMLAMSIVSLASMYFHNNPVVRQLAPAVFENLDVDGLADHLTEQAVALLEQSIKKELLHVS